MTLACLGACCKYCRPPPTTIFKTVMAAEKARAFWITGRGQSEIRAEQLAAPSRGEVLVRALYSGISRGTETLVFRRGAAERISCACAHRFRPATFRRR